MSPRLYADLAPWWPLISPPSHYRNEARVYGDVLAREGAGARPVLELGSGGGHNAAHMKARFALTLCDRSPAMLQQSRRLNPECEHLAGDMRDVRLARRFAAVFVHDAVDYLCSRDDLAALFATAAAHLSRGGVLLIAPDHFAEGFAPSTSHGGSDGVDGRAARYLQWTHAARDERYISDYAFALRHADGRVDIVHDRHELGLFARAIWRALAEAAGFSVSFERVPDWSDDEGGELVLCRLR